MPVLRTTRSGYPPLLAPRRYCPTPASVLQIACVWTWHHLLTQHCTAWHQFGGCPSAGTSIHSFSQLVAPLIDMVYILLLAAHPLLANSIRAMHLPIPRFLTWNAYSNHHHHQDSKTYAVWAWFETESNLHTIALAGYALVWHSSPTWCISSEALVLVLVAGPMPSSGQAMPIPGRKGLLIPVALQRWSRFELHLLAFEASDVHLALRLSSLFWPLHRLRPTSCICSPNRCILSTWHSFDPIHRTSAPSPIFLAPLFWILQPRLTRCIGIRIAVEHPPLCPGTSIRSLLGMVWDGTQHTGAPHPCRSGFGPQNPPRFRSEFRSGSSLSVGGREIPPSYAVMA